MPQTHDQKAGLEAQQRDLRAAGAEEVFAEHASSAAERATLAECLAYLRDGDVLVVTRPGRLAHRRTAGDRSRPDPPVCRSGGPGDGRREAGYPQSDVQADVDHPRRRGDLGTRDLLERQRDGVAKANAAGRYKGCKPTARPKSDDVLRP